MGTGARSKLRQKSGAAAAAAKARGAPSTVPAALATKKELRAGKKERREAARAKRGGGEAGGAVNETVVVKDATSRRDAKLAAGGPLSKLFGKPGAKAKQPRDAAAKEKAAAAVANWHSSQLSFAKREALVRKEIDQLTRVAGHAAYAADPLGALEQHLSVAAPRLSGHNPDLARPGARGYRPKGPAHGRTGPRPQ